MSGRFDLSVYVLLLCNSAPSHLGYVTNTGCPEIDVLLYIYYNKKTKKCRLMVYLLMNPPHFATQALMRSGIPHIRLSSVSAEMLLQAERTFRMRVISDA